MSYAAALDALTADPAAAPVVTVTLPEGRSIGEAASLVRQSGVSGSYVKAATQNPRSAKGFKSYGVPKGTRSLEGFLFPATYELKRGADRDASTLVAQQLAAFKRTFDPLDRKAAHRKNLTDYDVLIIASMIEREAAGRQGPPPRSPRSSTTACRSTSRSASTRRCATASTTGPGRSSSPSCRRTPRSTPGAPGPAADADRLARPGVDQGRAEPGQRQVPVLRRQALRQRRARVLVDRRAVPEGRRGLQQEARRSSAARTRRTAEAR